MERRARPAFLHNAPAVYIFDHPYYHPALLPELQDRFDAIEDQRHALIARLQTADESLLQHHPAPGSWSILQVVEHLLLVEQLVVKTMKRATRPIVRRRWWHRVGGWMVAFVFRHGFRVPAPSRKVVPVADTPLDVSSQNWDALRMELRSFLDATTPDSARLLGFRHPVSGPLDIPSTLDFIREHFDHHLRQIARIESSAGRVIASR